jgi:hypothetical protein
MRVELNANGRILVFIGDVFIGDGCLGMDPTDAVKLRNDLSRAITEAATAAAKAVEVVA